MPMRDADAWAEKLCADVLSCAPTEADCEAIARIIREAQEDGARAERERTEKAEAEVAGWRERALRAEGRVRELKSAGLSRLANLGEWPISRERKDIVFRIVAERDAAIARAEKAEREANGFNELLVETLDKLTEAECDRDEAVRALDAHKERADRAESDLHRRKW